MSGLNTVVYLCREVFDENSKPTQIEIEEQASRLGIDLEKEIYLLSIAEQCLLEPLPSDWFACYIENENKYFYYNKQRKISQWEHPLDEYYRQIVEKTRSEDSSTGQDISLNVILDEETLPDTMYHHTKNSNYEKKAVTEKRTVRFKTPIEESLDLDNSEDNMKFLGPIKLNTPFTNTSSALHNLPQFSNTNTFDQRNTASRSVLSKYNILPSKDELSRKSELGENVKKTNDEDPPTNLDYNTEKENLRKIDITLTEDSDRSESSTSSEIQTDNLNSDYEGIDQKEKDNIITTVQLNKRHERIDTALDDRRSAIDNFNEFQSIGTTKLNNVKKDDLVSDSGNSTARDSKIIQSSMASSSFSATKSKMAEITQRFPLNQFSNETKLFKRKPMESDEGIFEVKPNNSIKTKFESDNNLEDEKPTLLDDSRIKLMIEKHCDLIKNKLEESVKTNENILREKLIKNIDDVIHKQNDNFEKHIEARHNELFAKNELQFKNILKNMQESTEKSLIEECDKKYIQNVSNTEQMCAENFQKFKRDLEDYTELFKNKIQSELDAISNELKKDFSKNTEMITDSWNQTLGSYKNVELEKVKHNFEQIAENIKRDTDIEIRQFHLEFKEKLKTISEDKLNSVAEQLDVALREEINLVKKRVNESYEHKPQSKLYSDRSERAELNSAEYQTTGAHKVDFSDIKKKIQHCSNELNDALKLVHEISSTSEYTEREHYTNLSPNKCSVSCQTENTTKLCQKPSLQEYTYPVESSTMQFNSPYDVCSRDVNTRYADYLGQAKMSEELCSNYLTSYSQRLNYSPLHNLSQQELKVKAAEQNICRLIDTLNNFKHENVYHVPPSNTNISDEYKYTNIYQSLTPKQIAYNRTKPLREWLNRTDLENKKN